MLWQHTRTGDCCQTHLSFRLNVCPEVAFNFGRLLAVFASVNSQLKWSPSLAVLVKKKPDWNLLITRHDINGGNRGV